MRADEIISQIVSGFADVETTEHEGNTFFFYGAEHKFPFATLVINDTYDTVSNLSRPDVCRLNIGVSKPTYRALFPADAQPGAASDDTASAASPPSGYDYAALDVLMPHPEYAGHYWVCILNPSTETFEQQLQPLLAEAHRRLAGKRLRPADGE